MSAGTAAEASDTGAIRVAVGDGRRLIADALAALLGKMDGFDVTGVVGAQAGGDMSAAKQADVVVVSAGAEADEALDLVRSLRSASRSSRSCS